MEKYDPFTALREEVDRFYKTNRFNPMEVTNLYVQARALLSEHTRLMDEVSIVLSAYSSTQIEWSRLAIWGSNDNYPAALSHIKKIAPECKEIQGRVLQL